MVDGEELKGDVWYHLRVRRRRQGKQGGIDDDGKVLKGDGKALSGGGEALRMTEGMEGNGEAPNMHKIATVRL